RRAETRDCPVCNERIPTRLLAAHADLEAERVEAIIRRVGETDVDIELLDALEALVEEKSLGASKTPKANANANANADTDLLAEAAQRIQTIKRHRKQRNAKLKELVRGDEPGPSSSTSSRLRETWRRRGPGAATGGPCEIVCPVCMVSVRGDTDVLEAHVDACLADQARRLEEERREHMEHRRAAVRMSVDDVDEDNGPGHVGNVRGFTSSSLQHSSHTLTLQPGTGFATRDPRANDVDDEIDVDGDDEAVFGEAQFTEDDVVRAFPPPERIRPSDVGEEMDVDVDGEETLRELVAQGKVTSRERPAQQVLVGVGVEARDDEDADADKLELAILAAKNRGDQASLVGLLQSKIKMLESRTPTTTSLCRICISIYTDPTVSTGCWHTCCKQCWLRCLGETKVCPICKRITAAGELRRVYL
ncbi:hypothetical protein C8F01DRAFT_977914, partial [Mycena amicta]